MRLRALLVATTLTLAPPLERLGPDFQPLLADFAAASGRARLVMLLSPT